ncbi:[acyl-carrier-protein] S-malonyltransferase [Herbihabitans rhizosphaerae]|uniref:[acyl-carrier-protein] S-malonyltransferase n=2 Tax=Herbihabitans rhizosphaerae TaxID=1872711 RepID=A0A4Q7KPW2_9PSEU|nr:[acyl-carrier-protein] S-malonyltransferase [Herbihabitans rhizosphaerae]
MLTPWLELDGAADRIAAWSDAIELDLSRLGTTAEADEIKDTAVTQPLVVAAALLAAGELRKRIEIPADTLVAGHSVGELAAAAIAGVLSEDDAVRLAAVRGREMAAACALEPTGMSAVLGGDADEVLAAIDALGLTPANRNGAGQTVAAGLLTALEKLAENPPERARVKALPVAGAFHTEYMASALEALRDKASGVTVRDATLPLLSNADGTVVHTGSDVLRRLVAQVTRPVRWDACMDTMAQQGVTWSVELPPAGALTGLVKRALKGTVAGTLALRTPEDLDKVADLINGSAS